MPDLPVLAAVFLASLGLATIFVGELSVRLRNRRLNRRLDATTAAHKDLYRKSAGPSPFERVNRVWELAGDALLASPVWPRAQSLQSLVLAGIFASIGTGFVFYFMLSLPLFLALLGALIALPLVPRLIDGEAQRRQSDRFIETFPDTVDMLVRMLRAGLPLHAAVNRVGQEAPAPAGPIYVEVAEWLDVGVPLGDAFLIVNKRLKQMDFEFFGVSLSVQNMSGGNLTETLDSLSAIIRERILSGLKARSVSAEARMTANIISSLPILLFVGIQLIAPDYLTPLVNGENGYGLVTYALASFVVGILTIRTMISRLLVS